MRKMTHAKSQYQCGNEKNKIARMFIFICDWSNCHRQYVCSIHMSTVHEIQHIETHLEMALIDKLWCWWSNLFIQNDSHIEIYVSFLWFIELCYLPVARNSLWLKTDRKLFFWWETIRNGVVLVYFLRKY